MIHHPIADADLVAAQIRLDPSHEVQVFGEQRGLSHHALGPEDASIAVPILTISNEPGRDHAGAAVNGVAHRFARRVIVLSGILLGHEADVIEPTGGQQAGKRAQKTQPALSFRFVQARVAEARRRVPADRTPVVVALGQIHAPVHHHGEAQSGSGAKLQHADAALDPVAECHEPDAAELSQRAGAAGKVEPGTLAAVQLRHVHLSLAAGPARRDGLRPPS